MAVKMDTTGMHSIVFENKVCATTESYAWICPLLAKFTPWFLVFFLQFDLDLRSGKRGPVLVT